MQYKNEIDTLNGREPRDIETQVVRWRARSSRTDTMHYLQERRDSAKLELEQLRERLALEARVAAFRETEEGKAFETNIGTTGSFAVDDSGDGTRAGFYIALGSLLVTKATLRGVKDNLRQAIVLDEAFRKDFEHERTLLENPFQGEQAK